MIYAIVTYTRARLGLFRRGGIFEGATMRILFLIGAVVVGGFLVFLFVHALSTAGNSNANQISNFNPGAQLPGGGSSGGAS